MWLQPIVLTIQREAHKGFAIGVPLGKPLVIRNWIASLPFAHAVRHMAMTITKIFNSISFRDYSLLFIKKFINKGDFKMRNQTNNVFKIKRQKSKLFLIILCVFGLLFSWSCSCKNRVSNPDDTPTDGGVTPPPAGTFSISEATNNVTTNFVVKSASTVGEIKIGFVSANNYAYTLSYEVVDTNENNQILKSDTDYANDVLTIKKTGLDKIRAIPSVDAPAVRTITINFTFTADDKTLNNYTQNLSVEVKLTHAQTYADDNAKTSFIETVLRKGREMYFGGIEFGADNKIFDISKGIWDNNNSTFTVKGQNDNINKNVEIPKKEFKLFTDSYFSGVYKPYIANSNYDKGEGGGVNDNYYSLTYNNIIFSDEYECDITEITFRFEKAATDKWEE